MLFNSFQFLIFFPVIVAVYFIIPHRFRWVLLLIASYYFYMAWKPEYIVLIVFSTAVNYFAGLKMGKETERSKRKKYLYLSLFSSLGLLFLFKYFNFFNDSFRTIFINFNIAYHIPDFSLLLPIGISFYTFQTLSYTIDVYRGKRKPETHFGIFALYVSFFPQLVAGPIERSDRLMPQFYQKHDFDYYRVTDGLKRMAWGFFKKLVIADNLSRLVDTVYNNPTSFSGIQLIIATVFFAFQIFCDFSGYSDIAIGAAQVMGFKLMENFKRPYFSKSISEFWNRWHISLSSWFRDYFYISLGGNRVKIPRYYFNLFFTFLISGLWHGANWTFVLWGALHGLYLIIEKLITNIRMKLVKSLRLEKVPFIYKCIQVSIIFSLVCFAWIFFRANNIGEAIYIVRNLFVGFDKINNISALTSNIRAMGISMFDFFIAILSIGIMEVVHLWQRSGSIRKKIKSKPLVIRWSLYAGLIMYIIFFTSTSSQQFIYFQF